MLNLERYTLSAFDIRFYHNRSGHTTDRSVIGSAYNYFGIIIDGKAEFIAVEDGISFSLGPGELLYIPEGCRYVSKWYGDDGCRFYSLMFLFRNPYENRKYSIQKLSVSDPYPLKILEKINRSPDSITSLADFYNLYDNAQKRLTEVPRKKIREVILPALKVLESTEPCSIPELASRCCISEASFYRIFKEDMGCTPIEYRNTARCRRAAELLTTTEMSVEEVAEAVGCANAAYFRKMLGKYIGKTPRTIRKNLRGI